MSAAMQPRAERRTLNFVFDGKPYVGKEGDTLAAALMANGVRLLGRSFKFHRPRGLLGSGVEEANALVQLESGGHAEPNARATLVPLYEGLRARSQNAWPNVNRDVLGLLNLFQRVLPASFYYKSMMWPNWAFYERWVRRLAGLGQAPDKLDAQHYQKRNAHCDVLVCGAGPAGLSAALEAARAGLRVMLVDDREQLGGSLPGESTPVGGVPAADWLAEAGRQLGELPQLRLLLRTTVSGYYENNVLVAAERVTNHLGPRAPGHLPRERLWRIRARSVVLATGAIERPLVFPNNDRPGVMLASAVGHYANRFGVLAGRRVVVATNNDSAYRTALDLAAAGASEVSVVDTRERPPEDLARAVQERGIRVHAGHAVADVKGARGVRAVHIAPHAGGGVLSGAVRPLACDLLATSSGWTPTIHLYSQAGGSLRYDAQQLCLVPERCAQDVTVVGAANGTFALDDALAEGRRAGDELARRLTRGSAPTRSEVPAAPRGEARAVLAIEPYWYTRSTRTDRQWLDFQYDVKVSDIELAIRENFVSVEHVKRYTTGGMSVDQGKSSNFNILAVMAEVTGRPLPEVGTTRFRPPYQPVTIGAFAGPTLGELYAPWQELPAHAFHVARGARFGDYGWRRPDAYPRGQEDGAAATRREVLAVRQGVGLFDGSPLGKIEVRGPDAAVFLDRMYVNNMASLKPGFARYGLLANENGVLIDDGVIVRLAEDHYLVHATSAAVARVAPLFEEYLQCEWPELRVHVVNVTTQWANATLSGPKARAVMQSLPSDIDFSTGAFPHMQFRQGRVCGVPARVLRASFTGEVTFEVSVPARYAQALFEAVHAAGLGHDITPYGIDALEILRCEKGYLHVGGDTDGSTNPLDVGWGRVIDKKAGDFIGRRSLQRPGDRRGDRLQFVGLESVERGRVLPVGGHVVGEAPVRIPVRSQGYVTSACLSPTLDKAIALGIVSAGMSRIGEQVFVFAKGDVHAARIVAPSHYDPRGERLNG